MSVNIDYSNMVVGQNTEDTFKVPETCTRTCNSAELYFMKRGKAKHVNELVQLVQNQARENVEENLSKC